MQSLRQRWRKSSLTNKLIVVIGGITAIGTVGPPIVQTILSEIHRREDRRPVVINSHPPEFLQPFTCDTKGFHTGNMRLFAKNIGNDFADKVFFYFLPKVIPERKRGIPPIDDLPPVNCDVKRSSEGGISFIVPNDGKEVQVLMTNMAGGWMWLLDKSEPVQLYAVSCFYYQDFYGINHGTCDTYRLDLPSTKPLEKIYGTPTFMCDDAPKIGKFSQTLTGHCEN